MDQRAVELNRFTVWGLGFKVRCLGVRAWGLGLRVQGLGLGIWV